MSMSTTQRKVDIQVNISSLPCLENFFSSLACTNMGFRATMMTPARTH